MRVSLVAAFVASAVALASAPASASSTVTYEARLGPTVNATDAMTFFKACAPGQFTVEYVDENGVQTTTPRSASMTIVPSCRFVVAYPGPPPALKMVGMNFSATPRLGDAVRISQDSATGTTTVATQQIAVVATVPSPDRCEDVQMTVRGEPFAPAKFRSRGTQCEAYFTSEPLMTREVVVTLDGAKIPFTFPSVSAPPGDSRCISWNCVKNVTTASPSPGLGK